MSDQGKTFCVIEDNDVIRRLFVLLIERDNHKVISFNDGEKAVEWLENNQPDIVLCDIMLPGIGGEEILTFIRSLPYGKTVKVIALTAHARHGDRQRYLELGFDGYIPKPVEPQTFLLDVYAITQ